MTSWLATHLEATHGITVDALSKPQAWNPHVLRIDRREGPPWIARVFNPARPTARVEGDVAVLRHLEAVDFPAERCAVDEPVSTHDGHHVLVTTFVKGPQPTSSPADLRAMGERLGRLHSLPVPAGLPDGGAWHGDPAFEGAPARDVANALAMLESVRARVTGPAVERLGSLVDTLGGIDAGDGLPRSVIHPDPGPVNAIASPDDGVVLVDWTGGGIGPRVASLVQLLALGAPTAVVEGYREHVPALTDDELARLGAVLRVRPWFWAAYYFAMTVSGGTMPSGGEGWWPDDAALADVAHRAADAFTASSAASRP